MNTTEDAIVRAARAHAHEAARRLLDVLEGKILMMPFCSLVSASLTSAEWRDMEARVRRLRRALGNDPDEKERAA